MQELTGIDRRQCDCKTLSCSSVFAKLEKRQGYFFSDGYRLLHLMYLNCMLLQKCPAPDNFLERKI